MKNILLALLTAAIEILLPDEVMPIVRVDPYVDMLASMYAALAHGRRGRKPGRRKRRK